jgi:D,D-heptose 1,7-bisphosphate phosphatase
MNHPKAGPVKFVRPTRPGGRPAVFLDRDGTIIEHVHYLADPDDVRLIPGAAEAIEQLRKVGFACVVVTNQSAIGRGMITLAQLDLIHDEMNRQLAEAGTAVDAIEFCPEAPSGDDRTVIDHPDRKPAPGMLFRAAETMGLDLDASWMVGDLISDVLAGLNAGCQGNVLVKTGKDRGAGEPGPGAEYHVVDDISSAATLILERSKRPTQSETLRNPTR